MELPRDYNAAVDLIGRNLAAGRGGKTAFIDDAGHLRPQLQFLPVTRVERVAQAVT